MKKLNFKIIVLLVTLGSLFLSVTFAKIAEKQSGGSYKELFRRSYTTNLQFNGKENHLNLENQFESWMNWDNYGLYNGQEKYGWDIDHIIPLTTASNTEEMLRLNHYTNLQPLCSFKNRVIKRDN